MEQTLGVTESKGIFPSYHNDIADADRKTIEAFIQRLRKQLLEVLTGQTLAPETPHISASHSIDVGLTFIEVAIEELAPRYMRGYGAVSEQGVIDLNEIVTSLLSTAKEFHGYVERLAHSSD